MYMYSYITYLLVYHEKLIYLQFDTMFDHLVTILDSPCEFGIALFIEIGHPTHVSSFVLHLSIQGG